MFYLALNALGFYRNKPVTPTSGLPSTQSTNTPKGYERITVLTTGATVLTPPAGARVAIMVPETQAIRFRDDGVAPTASAGMPIGVGQPFEYTGTLSLWRGIEQTVGAILHVYYFD